MRPIHFWTLSIAFLSCAACSSTEDSDKNRNRVLGPIPPAPQTSLFFAISSADAGARCATGNYVAYIGGPPKASIGDPGPLQVDGQGFARILCRVSGSGTFEVELSAEKDATSFSLADGTVTGTSGTATISVAGHGTAGNKLVSDPGACALGLERQPYQVSEGRIWATFNCPSLNNPNQPESQCPVQGEFVFENCDR